MKWLASLGATPGDALGAAPDCAPTVTANRTAAPLKISRDFAARMIDDMPTILAGMSGSARFTPAGLRYAKQSDTVSLYERHCVSVTAAVFFSMRPDM